MSKVNYYLKNVPKEEFLQILKKENRSQYNLEMNLRRSIIISIAYDGKREIFSTGKFIELRLWDRVTMRIKILTETPVESIVDREWLDAKKTEIEKLISSAREEYRSVSKDELYELILRKVRNNNEAYSLKEILNQFFFDHKTKRGASVKLNTVKKYRSTISHVIKFQKHDKFIPELYNTDWLKKFKLYLMNDVRFGDNSHLNDNTVCKYIVALKTFFTHLKKKGFRIKAELDEIKLAETEQLVNIVTQHELKLLEQFNSNNPYHNQVRDVFLFQCYTGSRYGDIEKIKNEDIAVDMGMLIWNYIAEKTGAHISVPLNPNAIRILDRYKHLPTPLPHYCNQVINRELKLIAEQAGLNRIVKKVKYHDNIKTEVSWRLHEIITTHMARRTFISISLQLGVAERMVREISGHRDERSFRRYVNLNKSHLVAVTNAWASMLA
ncbi:tyrosine-type recombinase/integrase [Ferruginibacter sp. SUN106]|uniref:site-specific integrase n=1 Tax=Ferruginibacter sp. SUN106 TaxID=2978348 RepID=UPI003D3676C3